MDDIWHQILELLSLLATLTGAWLFIGLMVAVVYIKYRRDEFHPWERKAAMDCVWSIVAWPVVLFFWIIS